MPQFMYTAQNSSGSILKGSMESANEVSILNSLKEKGYYPLEIKEALPSRDLKIDLFERVGLKDIAVFCRQFSTIISSGLTLVNGLDILRQQTENKKLKRILDKSFEEVQKGKSLSETFRQFKDFPDLFVNMVEAGEASGQLEEVLNKMAKYYEKENKLRQKIKSALIYPSVIVVVTIAIVVFLVTKVLPMFIGMFQGAKLPLPTRILLSISYGLTTYWYIIILIIILLAYFIKRYLSSKEGRYNYHKFLFKLPILGKINTKVVTSRFSSTLATLLSSGIPVLKAMDIVEKTITNAVVEVGIAKCKENIEKGSGLSSPIASIGVFPRMLIEMINIGEQTGTLDDLLNRTSIFYEEEVDILVNGLTAIIEPVIIVVLGGVVAFIIVAMLLPMFDMYNIIGSQ